MRLFLTVIIVVSFLNSIVFGMRLTYIWHILKCLRYFTLFLLFNTRFSLNTQQFLQGLIPVTTFNFGPHEYVNFRDDKMS